jgi:hypothetical protein
MYAPGSFERDKTLERIQRLLQERAITEFDPMTGQPVKRSSIAVQPFEDKNHDLIAEIMRVWANSEAGRAAEQDNPEGYENVVLHGQEQEAAMLPPPAPGNGGPAPLPAGPPQGQLPAANVAGAAA